MSEAENEVEAWASLLGTVKTEYVLVGWELSALYTPWIFLERSIRLLQSMQQMITSMLLKSI